MLSRSTFSIRRLMPQRRQNSDDDLFWDNDEDASLKVTDGRGSPNPSLKVENRRRHNSGSWMSKGSTKRIPQPIIVVRGSEDLHRIAHLPPLPDTPHSSKSSLCSCEQHAAGHASPRRHPQGASPGPSPGHGSARSKTYGERRVSPPPGSPLENPRPSPQLPTQTRKTNKSVKSLPSPTKLTFDLLEALDIPPESEEMASPIPILPPTPPRSKSAPSVDREVEGRSENVQHLVREANEAFRAVGDGLRLEEGPEHSRQGIFSTSPPTRPPPAPPGRRRPAPLRQAILQKKLGKPAISPLKSPTRSASASRTKRQKSQKVRNGRPPRPVVQKQKSKWSVNPKDLLTVRLFNRFEVDEVLSPTRLQEIRMSGASQLQSRKSSETLRTVQSDASDTPVDPFSLQDLPTRIGAAGVRLSIPSPILEVPTPRTFDFGLVEDRTRTSVQGEGDKSTNEALLAVQRSSETTPTQSGPREEEGKDVMASKGLPFPALPAKNPARFASTSRSDLRGLPSIPEVLVTAPENFKDSSQPAPPTPRPSPDEPFIHLPSTAYTLTMPTFRHGPIRIAKADVALAYTGSKLATAVLDDTLDWTAFHMAILGGAGDLLAGSTDYSRRDGAEEDEVDALCEWFAGYGFAGYGALDGGSQPASPVTVVEGSCSPASSRSSKSGCHLPIPVEKEFPSGFWNRRSDDDDDETGREAESRFVRARSMGLRRWTVEGHPKRYEGRGMSIDSTRRPSVDSMASLPQSPMLDLVVSQDAGGNEYIVPMGYNLSHDLGDFLTWEAQNVYAGAFLGGQEEVQAELEG